MLKSLSIRSSGNFGFDNDDQHGTKRLNTLPLLANNG